MHTKLANSAFHSLFVPVDEFGEAAAIAKFDANFYLTNNEDVSARGDDPLEHYLTYGRIEGRRGHSADRPIDVLNSRGLQLHKKAAPRISRQAYLEKLGYAGKTDIDPFMHYISYGRDMGIEPHERFSREFYAAANSDVRKHQLDPFVHYLEFGYLELRRSTAEDYWIRPPCGLIARANLVRKFIDQSYYVKQLPQLEGTDVDLAGHYIIFGEAQGIKPCESFDPRSATGTKPAHLTWYEAALLDNGEMPLYPFHLKHEASDKIISGAPLSLLLPWPRTHNTIKQGERLNHATGFAASKTITLNSEASPTQGSLVEEDGVDAIFVDHILSLSKGRTLSLDIWDTVLRRSCYPDETKLRSARLLWVAGRADNPELDVLHPVDLFRFRQAAEAAVANQDFEFSFSDMATEWLKLLDLASDDYLDFVCQGELKIELGASFPDRTIVELIRRFKGRRIAISDFYLPRHQLEKIIIEKCGLSFDEMFVSCDYMETKRQGRLFEIARSGEPEGSVGLFHVGDRRDVDVEGARQHEKYQSALFYNSAHARRAEEMGVAFLSHLTGDFSKHADRISKLAKFNADDQAVDVAALAIAFSGFALKIVEDATSLDTEDIFFFSREGGFLKSVYDLAASVNVYDLPKYPVGKMLYVSRRATFGASIDGLDIPSLMLMWRQYSTQSPAALFSSLNLEPESFSSLLAKHGLELDKDVQYPWLDANFQNFLADAEVNQLANKALWQQRRELTAYLEKAGFAPHGIHQRLIVDIGWRGSIQANLARMVSGSVAGVYLGIENLLNPLLRNETKNGYLMDVPKGSHFRISEYAALEFLSNSLGGSVLKYRDGKPIRDVVPGEEAIIESHIIGFQSEILSSCRSILEYVRDHGLVSSDLLSLSHISVSAFLERPDPRVADAFTSAQHNESFGTGKVQTMGKELNLEELDANNGYEFHSAAKEWLGRTRWNEAQINSSAYQAQLSALAPAQRLCLPRIGNRPALPAYLTSTGDTVSIFAPVPIRASGGHRTIYGYARALAAAGHKVTVFSERRGDAYDYKEQELAGSGVKMFDHWFSGIRPRAAVATILHSSRYVSEFFADKVGKFYFVQDNESEFNPMSDNYIRGEDSFSQGHIHLCVGRWLPHMIATRYGAATIGAGLGVDSTVYKPLVDVDRRNRIAVLYQPEKPRRFGEHVGAALNIVKQRVPNAEIAIYGSHARPNLPFDFDHLGLVEDLGRINQLYNSSKVGLCISLTNPSRIPFEMMAAGCVPVDVYRYNNLFDYKDGTALLCYQSAESIASAIAHLLNDREDWEARSNASIVDAAKRTRSWETDVLVNALEAGLEGPLDGLPVGRPSYTSRPWISPADESPYVNRFMDWQRGLAGSESDERREAFFQGVSVQK